MSSVIWKARPKPSAYEVRAASWPSVAPARMAPLLRAARKSALEVDGLAADHAVHTGRRADFLHDAQKSRRVRVLLARDDLEGERQQRIAGEHGHAVAVDLVVRQLAAAVVVVVHRRQVVVDQGVRVDHLEGAGRRQVVRSLRADGIGRRHQEDRAQALAARHEAVAHRLSEARVKRRLLLQFTDELLFDQLLTLFPKFLQHIIIPLIPQYQACSLRPCPSLHSP